jgi:hypothetical protein
LLLILLEPLLSPAHSASQSPHCRAGGCTRASVAGYGTTHRSKCGASRCASRDVSLRGQRLVRYRVRIRGSSLRPARIESGLLDCPRMAFVTITVLLRLVLSFRRIHVDVLGASAFGQKQERE